ncbi:MAG: DciA family protein [Planctomycetota bacterium]
MSPSPEESASREHVEKMRTLRVRPDRDLSLGFLTDQFKREVARPFKQLGDLVELWAELLPKDVADGTRLESLQRGVLSVAVDSSARLYEVDRRLREGLETQLITRHKGGAFRRVKLRVDATGWSE